MLKEKLVDGGKTVGVADFVSKGVLESTEIRVNGKSQNCIQGIRCLPSF
jgi:hypothetical protein